jgi:hypothetical protein
MDGPTELITQSKGEQIMARIAFEGYYLKLDDKEYTIHCDVREIHDQAVHKAFGTKSEEGLQSALTRVDYRNWFRTNNCDREFSSVEEAQKAARTYFGEDPHGLGVRFKVVE